METPEHRNIMAVSLESSKRYKAYAVFDGRRLAITHCIPIVGAPSAWGEALRTEIDSRLLQGFAVAVEDKTESFCLGETSPFSFEEIVDGRSMLYHALDWHFSMMDLGQIIADKTVERFILHGGGEGQKIERRQDDKGRTVYSVDWSAFNGGVKAVLMCVCTAMMRPLTEQFIDEMFSVSNEYGVGYEYDPMRAFGAITHGRDMARIKKWEDILEK